MKIFIYAFVFGVNLNFISYSCAQVKSKSPNKIVFTSTRDGNWEIYSINADGSDLKRLTNNSGFHTPSDGWPSWSPDGKKIIFSQDTERHGQFSLWTMNANGSGKKRLTYFGKHGEALDGSWSPDGRKIAFSSYRHGKSEIYIMNSDGSSHQRITYHKSDDNAPSWSPDGSQICFVSNRDNKLGIYTMDKDGENVKARYLSDESVYLKPVWSPKGNKILFTSTLKKSTSKDPIAELNILEFDGNWGVYDKLKISDCSVYSVASWSPDGSQIVFTKQIGKNEEIMIINIDKTGLKNITNHSGRDFNPAWSRG